MAKKKKVSLTDEEARLKKKVSDKRGKLENPEGDSPFRKLHKRLNYSTLLSHSCASLLLGFSIGALSQSSF